MFASVFVSTIVWAIFESRSFGHKLESFTMLLMTIMWGVAFAFIEAMFYALAKTMTQMQSDLGHIFLLAVMAIVTLVVGFTFFTFLKRFELPKKQKEQTAPKDTLGQKRMDLYTE